MKYDCSQCDNIYYEKKEWIEHIEEVHVKQEKGNLLKFKLSIFSFLLYNRKESLLFNVS